MHFLPRPPLLFGLIFLTSHLLFCFSTELGRKVVEASSTAEALQRSLDAEVSDRSALEAVVTSACEGLGVPASGSSLRSWIEAFYSQAGERMRVALHVGVNKALAVVSSHYAGIDLPAVCEGTSSPMMRRRPRRKCRGLRTPRLPLGMPWPPSLMTRWSFPPRGSRA